MSRCIRGISDAILRLCAWQSSPQLLLWAQAMRAEMEEIEGGFAQLLWAIGAGLALCRARIGNRAVVNPPAPDGAGPPLAVGIVAFYHAIFSAVLISVIVWQLPTIREPWIDAMFPVLFIMLLAIIPGVLALGLWTLDESARLGSILFAICHALITWRWISEPWVAAHYLPRVRIAMDLAIIVVLLCPTVRKAFRPERIELGLRGR